MNLTAVVKAKTTSLGRCADFITCSSSSGEVVMKKRLVEMIIARNLTEKTAEVSNECDASRFITKMKTEKPAEKIRVLPTRFKIFDTAAMESITAITTASWVTE